MGDLNSKHPNLFCVKQNKNGKLLVEELEKSTLSLNLSYVNDRTMNKRPYRKNESADILSMTFCHPNIRSKVGGYSVGEDYGSQHSTISIRIPFTNQPTKVFSTRPNFAKANWSKFKEDLDENLPDISNLNIRNK